MKRKLFGLLIICLLNIPFASAQSKSASLIDKVWMLKSDEMSGVGIHSSLDENTELRFFKDGTWKSSHAMRNVRSGNWQLLNNDRTLAMTFGEEEVRYLLLNITGNELRYRLKKNAATYLYIWASFE